MEIFKNKTFGKAIELVLGKEKLIEISRKVLSYRSNAGLNTKLSKYSCPDDQVIAALVAWGEHKEFRYWEALNLEYTEALVKYKDSLSSRLIKSNCLIEAVKLKLKYPEGKISYDFNSPSGNISFFFDLDGERYRFRRKIRRFSNKSPIFFIGYRFVEPINKSDE